MINATQPHSTDAEQSVLGAIILDSEARQCVDVLDRMATTDFYHEQNREIFKAMLDVQSDQNAIDAVTVISKMPHHRQYVIDLVENTPGVANVAHYAGIVRNKSKERKGMEAMLMAYNALADESLSHGDKLAQAQVMSRVLEDDQDDVAEASLLSEIIKRRLPELQKLAEGGGDVGIPTGYSEIDRVIGGIQAGQLVTIGARTSVGKSAWGMNISENMAGKGSQVLYVSMEMSQSELADRVVCSQGRANNAMLKDIKNASEADWAAYSRGVMQASQLPIRVVEMARPKVGQIKAYARAMHRSGRLDVLVIDHLHLMNHDHQSEVQGIGNTTAELKGLAIELNIPVIVMAQLNRGNTKESRWPEMTDLRGSGSIEQDSNIIFLIHRDDDDADIKDKALILVKKNRNGESNLAIPLANNLQHFRFDNFAAFDEEAF